MGGALRTVLYSLFVYQQCAQALKRGTRLVCAVDCEMQKIISEEKAKDSAGSKKQKREK